MPASTSWRRWSGEAPVGEQTAVDARVQRLDPAVEHLREPGHGRDVGDRQAPLAQGPRRAAGRHELEPEPDEARRERRGGRSCPTRTAARGAEPARLRRPRSGSRRTRRPSTRERPGHELRHDPRQQLVLGGPDAFMQGGLVIARQDRHRHLGHDRPAVERVVDEVDRAAGDRDPVRERVTDGVGAGEGGQERGMRVEDAAGERGEDLRSDQPHVAGEHDRIGRDGLERLGERGIVAARDERRVDPLLRRPVERRALAIGEDEHDLRPEGAAVGCGGECAQVRPRPGHADRDPAAHPRRSSGPSAYRPPSSSTGTTSPIRRASSPSAANAVECGRHGIRSHDRDHPDPAVEGRPKLVVLDARPVRRTAA